LVNIATALKQRVHLQLEACDEEIGTPPSWQPATSAR
jgi:hypothetical protein